MGEGTARILDSMERLLPSASTPLVKAPPVTPPGHKPDGAAGLDPPEGTQQTEGRPDHGTEDFPSTTQAANQFSLNPMLATLCAHFDCDSPDTTEAEYLISMTDDEVEQ